MTDPNTIIALLVAACAVVLIAYGCKRLNDWLDDRAEREALRRRAQWEKEDMA